MLRDMLCAKTGALITKNKKAPGSFNSPAAEVSQRA